MTIFGDSIRAGEFGVAFEHLLYMVTETDLSLTSPSALFVERTAAALDYLRRIPVVP